MHSKPPFLLVEYGAHEIDSSGECACIASHVSLICAKIMNGKGKGLILTHVLEMLEGKFNVWVHTQVKTCRIVSLVSSCKFISLTEQRVKIAVRAKTYNVTFVAYSRLLCKLLVLAMYMFSSLSFSCQPNNVTFPLCCIMYLAEGAARTEPSVRFMYKNVLPCMYVWQAMWYHFA